MKLKRCSKMNWLKWIELYFWIIIGRVLFCDLPFFHKYWRLQIIKVYKKDLKRMIAKYKKCKKNPNMIKYEFGVQTLGLEDIKTMIEEKKKRIHQLNHRTWH